jgi:hypothetical protein
LGRKAMLKDASPKRAKYFGLARPRDKLLQYSNPN